MKKYQIISIIFFLSISVSAMEKERPVPLKSGNYKFQYCDVEYANPICFPGLDVKIQGRKIWVTNNTDRLKGHNGLIVSGTLSWHKNSNSWIIATNAADKIAKEVGGCSDGPREIDLTNRTFYSC